MKQICAHVAGENIGEAVTSLESDDNGDFFREVVSSATREHERATYAYDKCDHGQWREMVRGSIQAAHTVTHSHEHATCIY